MNNTTIGWTDWTWGVLRGCSRTMAAGATTSGCGDPTGGGCYAERNAWRFHGPGLPYEGLVRMTPNGARWTGKVLFVDKHLLDPVKVKRPSNIFTTSVSDPFHERVSNETIAVIMGVMVITPQHRHQMLTKRADRMREWYEWIAKEAASSNGGMGMSPGAWCFTLLQRYVNHDPHRVFSDGDRKRLARQDVVDAALSATWPLPNVMPMVSVEHQLAAADRIPDLLMTPAALRGISVEPMIGPVDLLEWFDPTGCCECGGEHGYHCAPGKCPKDQPWRHTETNYALLDPDTMEFVRRATPAEVASGLGVVSIGEDPQLDWIVIGVESGPGSRVCDLAWVRELIEQCERYGKDIFLKQLNPLVYDEDERGAITCGAGSTQKGHGLIGEPYLDGKQWTEHVEIVDGP